MMEVREFHDKYSESLETEFRKLEGSDEDAKKTHPQGWKAPRPYLRVVPQPTK